jgi:MFS family permease
MEQYRSLFRNRNFLFLWLSGAISNVGDFFNSLALIKILSEDPAHLGFYMALIMIAKMAPGVLLGPVAGVVADRLPRRTVMIVSDLIRAVLVLGLVFVERPAFIITLVCLSSVASVFFSPASGAILPSLVGKDELVTAGSLAVMTQRMAMLLGNGIGAAVLVVAGAHSVFYIDAASFVVSALLIALMVVPAVQRIKPAQDEEPQGVWQKFKGDLKETVVFLKGAHIIRHVLTIFALGAVSDSALNVLLVTFFTVDRGMPTEFLGVVMALNGGAAVVGVLIIGSFGNRVRWSHLISFGFIAVWITMMVALSIHHPIASAGFIVLLGLASGAINVGSQAALGERVPDWVRGRIFGAWGMINGLIFVVGVLAAGMLSDFIGSTVTLMGSSMFYLIAGIYGLVAFRSLPPTSESVNLAG